MKDLLNPLLVKAIAQIAKLEDEFLQLGSTLRHLQQSSPKDFKRLASLPQLGLRKAYYLVSIDKAFGGKKIPPERLKKIGWMSEKRRVRARSKLTDDACFVRRIVTGDNPRLRAI
jgi:hypothetical protein